MKIAIVGLGKMGHQFVVRLIEDGHEVIAFDRDSQQVDLASQVGASGVHSREDVVTKFEQDQPIVWLMIPSNAVDEEIEAWKSILGEKSILIDGGNSDFRLTKKRADILSQASIELIDVGTSGGILGLENGFSMMVGGKKETVDLIEPILSSLTKPHGTFHYFGPSGSGHFIKMVHNAIEYGLMESLAEGYQLLKTGPYQDLDLAAIGEVWQHGSIVQSLLNNLAKDIFSENPNLEGIEGIVSESGETKWSLELAKELNIDMPAISAAYDVRIRSQSGEVNFATKFLAALRNKFGGHATNPKK